MAVKLKMVCLCCGSTDVGRDAWAAWNEETQQWELRGDPFDEGICFTCESTGKSVIDMIEETIPDEPTEATRFVHQQEKTNGEA